MKIGVNILNFGPGTNLASLERCAIPLRYTRWLREVRVKPLQTTLWLVVLAIAAGIAPAQVPPELAKQIATIGRGVCVPETAQIYRPLPFQPTLSGRHDHARHFLWARSQECP
jgi:hypothetical protein